MFKDGPKELMRLMQKNSFQMNIWIDIECLISNLLLTLPWSSDVLSITKFKNKPSQYHVNMWLETVMIPPCRLKPTLTVAKAGYSEGPKPINKYSAFWSPTFCS